MSGFSRVEVRFAFRSGHCQKAHTANAINRVVIIFPVKELRGASDLVTSNLKVNSKQNKQHRYADSKMASGPSDERLSRIDLGQLVLLIECKLQSIENAELEIDLAQIVLDYLFAGAEVKGNLLVVHASCDAGDDHQLHV